MAAPSRPARARGTFPLAAITLAASVTLAATACQSGGAPGPGTASPTPALQPAAADAPPSETAAAPARTPPAPRSKLDEPNTLHGIYTEAQAARGRGVFEEVCSECHAPDDWTQEAFLDRWEEASVFRLWYWIYERMPHGNPGSLTREQVTDALTYIFELNGLPPGPDELADDDDSIDDYWIIWGRMEPRAGEHPAVLRAIRARTAVNPTWRP